MGSSKFLTRDNTGRQKLVSGVSSSGGVVTGNEVVALTGGVISPTLLPPGVEIQVKEYVTSEALSAGDFVNIWSDSGTDKARKADAGNNRPAMGFVLAGVSSGAIASVFNKGENNQVTGLTTGVSYFLSATTPGGVSATPPSTTGKIIQFLGKAMSANSIAFELDEETLIE
jgi:hypothetical protein